VENRPEKGIALFVCSQYTDLAPFAQGRSTERPLKAVLVGSQNQSACDAIKSGMRPHYAVEVASSRFACLEHFRRKRYEFLFIDVELLREGNTDNNYKDALQPFWRVSPTAPIVVMASQEAVRDAVRVVKAGANDYLTYPINPEEVEYVTRSIYESVVLESELDYLRDQFWNDDSREVVQTKSPLMKRIFDRIRSVSPTRSTVLLVGETGTGKGVLARLIHRHSNRKDGPFISIHCGAIPDTLLESEMFGHERGAFTGAVRRKLGKFEIAQGGTIFLDEIGTITPAAQIKLLEILQDGSFHRLGGDEILEADVRVIAASNADLFRMSGRGEFRNDLYYRLNVFPLQIPALRDRSEDIPHIAHTILKRLNRLHSKEIRDIEPGVLQAFTSYPWPGNIREMENLMERAYILEKTPVLTPSGFPEEVFSSGRLRVDLTSPGLLTLNEIRRQAIEYAEGRYLRELLTVKKGRVKDSADTAGLSTRQLHKLMKKHGIRKELFKPPAPK
jgi:DNA-binding NtrC family response regulator